MPVKPLERVPGNLEPIPELDWHGFDRAVEDNTDLSRSTEVLILNRSADKSSVTFNAVHSNGTDGVFSHEDPELLSGRQRVYHAIAIAASLDALLVSDSRPIKTLHHRIGDWEQDTNQRSEFEEKIIAISGLTDLTGRKRADAIDGWLEKAWSLDFPKLNEDLNNDPDLALRLQRVDPEVAGDQLLTAVRLEGFGMKEFNDPQYSEFSDLDLVVPVPILMNKFNALGAQPQDAVAVGLYAKQEER